MLAQQRIDIQRSAHVLGGIDVADLDMRAVLGGVNLLQVGGGDGKHHAARLRKARHAATELVQLAGQALLVAFAQEIDLRSDPTVLVVEQFQRPDIGDQPRSADPHLDLATDLACAGDDRIGAQRRFVERRDVEHELAACARNVGNRADSAHGNGAGQVGGHGRRCGRHGLEAAWPHIDAVSHSGSVSPGPAPTIKGEG